MVNIIKKLLLLVPIPVMIFATTWAVDPANIKDTGTYEAGVASILLSGKNVANVKNYNERILQKKLVFGLAKPPEVLVLGSSRSMEINSSFFPGHSVINGSVSGASIEDYLGVFDLYLKRGFKPKVLVIGCDPWVLNRNNDQKRWKSLDSEYLEMRSILKCPSASSSSTWPAIEKIGNYCEFISPAYFQQSCRDLISNKHSKKYWPTEQPQADEQLKLADGSIMYGKEFRDRTIQDVTRDAKNFATAEHMYSLDKFNELDRSTMQILGSFIAYLKSNKIRVLIFLPPYHPIAYQAITSNPSYGKVAEAERWYKSLTDKYGVEVIGSYNPMMFDLEGADFHDGMHPKEKAIQKIFSCTPRCTAPH